MKCPNCGAENPIDKRYCGNCGARLSVYDGTVEPYFSYGSFGSTATFTREAYWTRIGVLLVLWAMLVGIVFYFYFLSGQTVLLTLGIGMTLFLPVLYGIAVYRVRAYRRQREMEKGF